MVLNRTTFLCLLVLSRPGWVGGAAPRLPTSTRAHAVNSHQTRRTLRPFFAAAKTMVGGSGHGRAKALALRGGSAATPGKDAALALDVEVGATAPEDSLIRKARWRVGMVLSSSLIFGLGVLLMRGRRSALEFFACYLVELTLSLDTTFVFVMLFDYFQVRRAHSQPGAPYQF